MEEGLWSPLFTKHVNDWEMEVIEKKFPLLQTKRIIREVNDKMIWKKEKKKKKRIVFNQIFLYNLKGGKGGPFAKEHYLEPMGPI